MNLKKLTKKVPFYRHYKVFFFIQLSNSRFFNTSGMLYKSMSLKDKLPNMTEEEQYQLLAEDGMLVKRPIIVGEDFVLTGFKEKEWEEVL